MGGRSVPGRYQEGQAAPTPIPEGFTSANTGSHFRENQTSMSKIVLRVKRRKCRQDPARDTNELEQQHAGLGWAQFRRFLPLHGHCVSLIPCTPCAAPTSLHLSASSHCLQRGTGNLCWVLGLGWAVCSTPHPCCLCSLVRLQAAWDRLCRLFLQAVKTRSNFRVST